MSVQVPTPTRSPVRGVRVGGEKVARSRGFEWLARLGFVARGLIYGIIGVLATKLALGAGGTTTNQQGALKTIARQPFGKVLLILAAVGLAGYALWRFTHALLGHGPEDSDSRFDRVAALGSGIVYAGLCAIAVEILLGSSSGGSSNASKTTAGVFGWPAGNWLVGIAGGVLIGIGVYQGYRGIGKDFLKDSKTEQMRPRVRNWIEWIGCFGHLARMVVFGLVGLFLIKAAIEYNPNNAVGLDGALAKIAHASYGAPLLGVVAAGLIAFGVYSLSDARYRRIQAKTFFPRWAPPTILGLGAPRPAAWLAGRYFLVAASAPAVAMFVDVMVYARAVDPPLLVLMLKLRDRLLDRSREARDERVISRRVAAMPV